MNKESKKTNDQNEILWLFILLTILLFIFNLIWLWIASLVIVILFLPKINFKIKWLIILPLVLFLWYTFIFIKDPNIEIISKLDNGDNIKYKLELNIKNTTSLYINDEEQKISWEKFIKEFDLQNLENNFNIKAWNKNIKFDSENIIVKRIKTEKEKSNEKIKEEKKLKQEQEEKEKYAEEVRKNPKKVFDEWTFKVQCKNSIKNLLKNPKTANFIDVKVFYTWIKWKEWIIKWTVEWKNDFWVPIESYFECIFIFNEKDLKFNYKYNIYQ